MSEFEKYWSGQMELFGLGYNKYANSTGKDRDSEYVGVETIDGKPRNCDSCGNLATKPCACPVCLHTFRHPQSSIHVDNVRWLCFCLVRGFIKTGVDSHIDFITLWISFLKICFKSAASSATWIASSKRGTTTIVTATRRNWTMFDVDARSAFS